MHVQNAQGSGLWQVWVQRSEEQAGIESEGKCQGAEALPHPPTGRGLDLGQGSGPQ